MTTSVRSSIYLAKRSEWDRSADAVSVSIPRAFRGPLIDVIKIKITVTVIGAIASFEGD